MLSTFAKLSTRRYAQQGQSARALIEQNQRFFAGFGAPVKETTIGVPKETYPEERRVAMSPEAATRLIKDGFKI